ncbi:MAG: SDR family NAD(P)-dependent oxidoreductase [Pseudomonadota bacterium]
MRISPDQKPLPSGLAAKTPASEIVKGVDLAGKTAIVTGGYSGIGLETTKALQSAGATVIVPVRNPEKADAALAGLEGDVASAPMDLADLGSVKRFANDFLAAHKSLDLLINNAGIMACPETRVGPGWEAQFAVNHLGHFVLSTALAPALEKADGARLVQLSSLAHKRSQIRFDDFHFEKEPYEKWTAYGQSKTANALFAVEFDRRMRERGVRAFAVHPGGIMTPLQRHLPKEEMIALGWIDENGDTPDAVKDFFKTPEEGASTTVWCATAAALDGLGGLYCEDCDVGQLATEESPRYFHVAPWAVDAEAAARLWTETEKMLTA